MSATDEVLKGYEASPGVASGTVRLVRESDGFGDVDDGDIIVAEMTTPEMVPAMQRAGAIVTDDGGVTCHAAIVSRELGIPAVVGTGSATRRLRDGQHVTVDGDRGMIEVGSPEDDPSAASRTGAGPMGSSDSPDREGGPGTGAPPSPTATEVHVNVSIPQQAGRAAATGADGVGLLRLEHVLLATNATPTHFIENEGSGAYVDELCDGLLAVADAFYPRPIRIRTLDAPTDELRELEGGEREPIEHNPMLGLRGVRRSLAEPETCQLALRAIGRLVSLGYDNLEVMFPLVNDEDDVRRARALLEAADLDPASIDWGVMIETPAAALRTAAIAGSGIDFATFGTNDLVQFTLAVDRNNGAIADRFEATHPAVLELLGLAIDRYRERGIPVGIAGQAGSDPEVVRFLVNRGISSISANVDAVDRVSRTVRRAERRLLLEAARG